MSFDKFLNQCAADCVEAAVPPKTMTKLEHQLRLSLIAAHMEKARDFLARSEIAINPSLSLVLFQHAEEHLEDAERIRSYMEDSDMTRKEATAMVDFEDGK